MTTRKIVLLSFILTAALISIRCGYEPPLHATAHSWLDIELGETPIEVQIALTRKEKAEGLMHRESLNPNQGMLFVFESPSKQRFWMKDTHLPLSVAFFDTNGKLLEIHALYPQDRNPVESHASNIVMALEMNQDWFQMHNISLGTMLNKELLDKAFSRRGMDVKKFRWYQPE